MLPNPASDLLVIQSGVAFSSISIHDLTGRLLVNDQYSNNSNKSTISLEMLKPGMYLCSVEIQGRKETKRLVVQ
jgi:hypothetical protein